MQTEYILNFHLMRFYITNPEKKVEKFIRIM